MAARSYRPFASVEEYVLRCTDEIWVDRGVGLIESQYYADDVVVHSAFGTVRGVAPVVQGTLQSISSYPDEVGFGEDVVWERRGNDGFVSSHRVYSTGTNTGWTTYGPPTARHFEKRAMAHCLVREGRIVEEWVVRDEFRLITDLGYDPDAIVAQLAREDPWRPLELGAPPADPLSLGASGPRIASAADSDCRRVVEMIEETWNARRLDRTSDYYDRDVVLLTSRGRTLQGLRQHSTETMDVLAPFPDARMRVIDVCAHDHPRHGRRVSVVWVLEGNYCGHERFGPTTRLPVEVLGSSQYALDDGLIYREHRVYDELALSIQIEQGRQRSVVD